MKCPECVKLDQRSKVYANGPAFTTLVYCEPFYDEDGRHHHHDRNITTIGYRCSKAHEWTERTTPKCWCGWPQVEAT